MDIAQILDLGLSGVLLTALVVLWRRHTALSDRFYDYLTRKAEGGDAVAQQVKNGDKP